MVHGFAWCYNPSNHRIAIDNEPVVTIYANSSLENVGDPGYISVDSLLYFRANLSNEPHILRVDNDDGAGFLGLDHVEVISVTGGTAMNRRPASSATASAGLPTASTNSKQKASVGVIVGPVVGVGIPFLLFLLVAFILIRRRRRPKSLDAEHSQILPFDSAIASSPPPPPPPPPGLGRISEKTRTTREPASIATFSSVPPTTTATSSSTPDLYPATGALYLNEKRDYAARTEPRPSTDETPDQIRVRELQDELARARAGGVSSMAELQAMRRDLQQLMQMVERPRVPNDDLQPPPEYDARTETRPAGV